MFISVILSNCPNTQETWQVKPFLNSNIKKDMLITRKKCYLNVAGTFLNITVGNFLKIQKTWQIECSSSTKHVAEMLWECYVKALSEQKIWTFFLSHKKKHVRRFVNLILNHFLNKKMSENCNWPKTNKHWLFIQEREDLFLMPKMLLEYL